MSWFMSPAMQPLHAFAPLVVVTITVLLAMLSIAIKRWHGLTATVSVLGLNVALLVLLGQILGWFTGFDLQASQAVINGSVYAHLFQIDPYAQFNMVVILVCSLACCTLSYAYFRTFTDHKDELYLLMLIATLGAMLMVCAQNLAAMFISLELLSVPLYGMLAYAFMRSRSLEAGLKYLVLSATASATLLMGMAFIYSQTGTLQFKPIAATLPQLLQSPILLLGATMMTIAIAFKLSVAPFHAWTPDVYQGAPVPVAAYLASVSKVAMMGLAIRFFVDSAVLALPSVQLIVMIMATLSILLGNLLALKQTNLKRLFGYSSIAHMGYVLVVAVSIGPASPTVTNMYMAMYALTSIGVFGVIALMSSTYRLSGEASDLHHYRGLFWRRPVLTGVMTVMLLSMAGIPLTAGFITKFFAVLAAVQGMQWFLAVMIVVGSAIGLFYYLRVMLTMFKRPKEAHEIEFDALWRWGAQTGGLMVILVTLIVLYFGVLPSKLIEWSTLAMIW